MSSLKSVGPAVVLIACVCLAGAGCSSSPLKKSSSPFDLLSAPFTANKKPKRSKTADTIPSAKSVGYTPNQPKAK